MIASKIAKLICGASILAIVAQAAPGQDLDTRSQLPDGYEEVPIEWEVRAFPDGDVLHMNGTAEKVYSELITLNPRFDSDFLAARDEEEEDSNEVSLEARDKCSRDWSLVRCNTNRGSGKTEAIKDGISYLRKIGGKPSLPAGPAKCGRVSCSYASAIFWCNDNKRRKTLGSYDSIANGAQVSSSRLAQLTLGR